MFFLFSGKAYAIFALLFGFSFFIQFDNQARKGKDFRLRFFWRLVLLFFIGCFNASFFPGEILVLYSILGIVLIPVCKLSNKMVLAIAVFLMLQPMEWGKFMYALMHPEYVASKEQWLVHCMRIYPYMEGTSFWEMVKSNLWDGSCIASLGLELWAFLPDIGSLYAGHVVGAQGIVCRSGEAPDVLTRTFVIGVVCFIPLYYLSLSLPGLLERTEELRPMSTIVSSLRNFSFMCVLVSSFIFLWQWKAPHKVLHGLVPYGKMSLTNYLTQSMVGSFIYFGYGLSLYDDLGTTASFAVGILLFILQLGFCHWWLAHHKQGPFEGVWRKATWMFS